MTAWTRARAAVRSDDVARAVALCVETRRGLLVVGAPGAGATTFAADVAAGLRAAGVAAVRVDDADRSARVITVPRDAVLLVSARRGAELADSLMPTLRMRTTRWPLHPLTRAECAELVRAATRMSLSARLEETLWRASHGNPAAARAAWEEFDRRSWLRTRGHAADLAVDPHVALAALDADPAAWAGVDDLAALTSVAIAQRMPLPELARLHAGERVAALVEAGLLAVRSTAGVDIANVDPPLLATALRRRATPDAVQRAHTTMLDSPHAAPPRSTLWALANGLPVDAATVLASARAALEEHEYDTAYDLADTAPRVLTLEPGEHAALLLAGATALRFLERLSEAAEALDRASDIARAIAHAHPAAADDDAFAGLVIEVVAARADLLHYVDRDPTRALEAIDAGTALAHTSALARGSLTALRVLHLAYSGRHREAVAAYRDRTDPLPPAWERRLDALHAVSLDVLGHPDAGLAVLRTLARRARSMRHSAWASEEYLGALLTTVLHGDGVRALNDELTPFALADRDVHVRIDPAMRRFADAEIALAAGETETALAAATDAVHAIETDGPDDYLPRALSLQAAANAALGRDADARAGLGRLRELPGATNALVGPDVRASIANALSWLDEPARALAICHELVAEGLYGAAARAALGGVLVGDRELCALAARLEVSGRVPGLLRDLATARGADDARGLLDAAQRAAALGLGLVAATAARAAHALATPGSHLETQSERAVAATVGVVFAPAESTPVTPAVPLTRREAEIVALIARGDTNAEIAQHLHLSKRTVEGHINRIYTKTGRRLRADPVR